MNTPFVRNVTWLGLTQVANFVLPFIAVPYLARTLLPAGYGTMAFALSIAAFLGLICDYGFGWNGVQSVSAHRNDPAQLRQLYADIVGAKLLLLVGCALPFGACLALFESLRSSAGVYLAAFSGTIGSVIFPGWFLQGLERIGVLALLSLVARVASVASIIILVEGPEDVALATLLTASPLLVTGSVAVLLIVRWMGGLSPPTVLGIKRQLLSGWSVFLTSITVNAYTAAQTMIVGIIGGAVPAGYYAAADKCMSAGKALLGIVAQAALPRVAYQAKHEPEAGVDFIHKLLVLSPVLLVVSAIMLVFPEQLVRLIFGDAFVASVAPLFQILAPIPFLLSLSSCFASLYMFNYGHKRRWSQMLVGASTLSLACIVALQAVMPVERAAAVGSLVAEVFVFVVSGLTYAGARRRRR